MILETSEKPKNNLQTALTTQARPPFRVRIEQASVFLRKQYPALFAGDPKPLKIGIHKDLMERHPEVDAPGLKRALTLYCRSFRYKRKLVAAAVRVDLDRNPSGEVTAEQAARAQEQLAARKQLAPSEKPAQVNPPKPEPVAPPEPPPPSDAIGRPTLRLKKPSSAVVAAAVSRKGGKL